MKVFTIAVIFFLIISSPAAVVSSVPRTLSFQGVLTDDAGAVVPDGTYTLTFKIYNTASGGTALWSEEQSSIQVRGGIFNAILGSVNPLDIDFDVPYWLGISVEGAAELTPRIELSSSPYSLSAAQIKGTNIFADTGNVGIGTTAPLEKLDIRGAVKIGDTKNTNAGTIRWNGTDFEGYDGSVWKSLTSNGGDSLPQGTEGQTLRYKASVGWVATGNLYNDGARIGIGTTSPNRNLHIHQDTNGTVGIMIENRDTGSSSAEAVSFIDENGDKAGIELYDDEGLYPSRMRIFNERPNGSLLLSNGMGSVVIDSSGGTVLSNSGGSLEFRSSEIKLFRTGNFNAEARLYGSSRGGILSLYDEEWNNVGGIEADFDGEGGWMGVASDINYNNGIYLDGNNWGSKEPALTIDGSSHAAVFDMSQSGDASVQLPGSAISSIEISNEPGASSNATTDISEIQLLSGWNDIMTTTITAPSVGYVLVIASCQVRMDHTQCTGIAGTLAQFGVSDASDPHDVPVNQTLSLKIPCPLPTHEYYEHPVTVHGLFLTGPGMHTFYFRAYDVSGYIYLSKIQLTAVFIPTAYGSVAQSQYGLSGVSPRGTQARGPLTEAEIASERERSVRANEERMERELAEMQKRLNEIKAQLELTKKKQLSSGE